MTLSQKIIALIILVLIGVWITAIKINPPIYTKNEHFLTMSTGAEIYFLAEKTDTLDSAAKIVKEMFRLTEKHCNIFVPTSEISQINAHASDSPMVCSEYMVDLLTWCDMAYTLSHGTFDPTIRPLMKLWGFHQKIEKLPSADSIKACIENVGFNRVKLTNRTIALPQGMSLDFGGIAKGYALHKATEEVLKLNLKSGVINLGGNLSVFGDEPITIGIRHPIETDRSALSTQIQNQAIATSGNYERYVIIDSQRYTHIVDPRTGLPVHNGILAVTVIAPNGLIADILSTTAFILDKPFAEEYLSQHSDAVFIFFYDAPQTKAKYRVEILGKHPFPIIPNL